MKWQHSESLWNFGYCKGWEAAENIIYKHEGGKFPSLPWIFWNDKTNNIHGGFVEDSNGKNIIYSYQVEKDIVRVSNDDTFIHIGDFND